MHRPYPVDGTSVRNGFVSDDWLAYLLFGVGADIVLVDRFVHLTPLHDVQFVVGLLVCLTASYHVGSHWELVVLVLATVVLV